MNMKDAEKKAEAIYDQGPKFEAGNVINRDAWVKKIAIAIREAVDEERAKRRNKGCCFAGVGSACPIHEAKAIRARGEKK